MIEFGSDFHYIKLNIEKGVSLCDSYRDASLFAFGRQPIIALIEQKRWKRIWMPEYFCYEVIGSIAKTGIEIQYYNDYLGKEDNNTIKSIQFEDGDVLFRVNYFGMRSFRDNSNILVPVIEDHSHDLLGEWSRKSNADYCIASLRKTLPLAEGGIIWSPKGLILPESKNVDVNNEIFATQRWKAMDIKTQYLEGQDIDKDAFRSLYIETEESIDSISLCGLSSLDTKYLKGFDMQSWKVSKRNNWKELYKLCQSSHYTIIQPESDECNPFSFVLICHSEEERNNLCRYLIKNCVYPAILWVYPRNSSVEAMTISKRMLSIHCDGRYSVEDINKLATIINSCDYE